MNRIRKRVWLDVWFNASFGEWNNDLTIITNVHKKWYKWWMMWLPFNIEVLWKIRKIELSFLFTLKEQIVFMIEFKWHVYIRVEMCLRIYMTLFIVPRIAFDASNIAGAVLWVINFLLRLKTNNCIYRKTCLGSSWRHLCITLFSLL